MKISAKKYDSARISGVNMSAVHCGFARGPKRLQKQCNKCAKDKSEQKVSKYRSVDVAQYKSWIHLQNVVSCNILLSKWQMNQDCSSDSNHTPFAVLSPFLMFFTAACLFPGKRLKISCQMAPTLPCLFPISCPPPPFVTFDTFWQTKPHTELGLLAVARWLSFLVLCHHHLSPSCDL